MAGSTRYRRPGPWVWLSGVAPSFHDHRHGQNMNVLIHYICGIAMVLLYPEQFLYICCCAHAPAISV